MRVYLDAVRRDDLPRFARWFADPALAAVLTPGIALPLGPEDEEEWFDNMRARRKDGREHVFAVRRLESGDAIGTVGITLERDRHSGTAGIAIADPDARGRGLGVEAFHLLLRFAFDEVGLHRVELRVFDFNEPAKRLYRRLGFREEGRLRDAVFRDGRYHDELVMAMLEGDYQTSDPGARPPGWIPAAVSQPRSPE